MTEFSEPRPDIPGWDWDANDYSWLASESGLHVDGVSIFFIHGGRVRHQAHIPSGTYGIEEFCALVRERAKGLDDPIVCWSDTGDGDLDLWVEGTRLPNKDDLERLESARSHEIYRDRLDAQHLKRRHPEWFTDEAP